MIIVESIHAIPEPRMICYVAGIDPRLENVGFTWAPEWLAHEFSRECNPPNDKHEAFGFHGAFLIWQGVGPRSINGTR